MVDSFLLSGYSSSLSSSVELSINASTFIPIIIKSQFASFGHIQYSRFRNRFCTTVNSRYNELLGTSILLRYN